METTKARQFIFGVHIELNEYYQEQQQISRMSALVTPDWPLKKNFNLDFAHLLLGLDSSYLA